MPTGSESRIKGQEPWELLCCQLSQPPMALVLFNREGACDQPDGC